MKLTKSKEAKIKIEQFKYKKKVHNKNASEDLNNLSNPQNFFLSKLINSNANNNNIKKNSNNTNNLIKENLPNLKTNIQSIFSNDDKKQKAIQYLIKIRKDRNPSPSTDFRKILSDISSDNILNKKENKKEKEIYTTPYDNNKNRYIHYLNKSIIASFNLSQNNIDLKPIYKRDEYNYTISNNKQNLNDCNSPFLINNYSNKNIIKNNKTIDNLHTNENNPINNIKNYMTSSHNNYNLDNCVKNYNLSNLKNKKLNLQNIEKNYEYYQENKNSSRRNYTSKIDKDEKTFYIHKKPIYSKINVQNALTDRNIINPNSITKKLNNIKNKKYIDSIIKRDDYKINTFNNTNKNLNISENKYNKFINNKINKKKFDNNILYIKNSIQLNLINKTKKEKKNKNKNSYIINNHFEFNIIKNNQNKIEFNNEEEIIEYIKNKYKKEKIKELFFNEYEKNEKLENEINRLKYENKQYKKELVDIRNQYNDLFKEINIIKEENEKLKDNIINNMINDDNNEEYNE